MSVIQLNQYVNMTASELLDASNTALKLMDLQVMLGLKKEFERRLRILEGDFNE